MKQISTFILIALCALASGSGYAQSHVIPGREQLPVIEKITEARKSGLLLRIDSFYKSAININDSSKCVFKTEKEQQLHTDAYRKFLQDLGDYLWEHKFRWQQTTKCWNRIYFHSDGAVDYYMFDFKTKLPEEQIKRYEELFREFAKTHKIGVHASVGFAQCSPVIFEDK